MPAGEPVSDVEVLAKEVLDALIKDQIPPTPHKYEVYFDRLLENKSEQLRKDIKEIQSFETDSENQKAIELETTLKDGFGSIKSILHLTATMYKNIGLMSKILDKKGADLSSNPQGAAVIARSLKKDIEKLSAITAKQIDSMKKTYEEVAHIVKHVESETVFDSKFNIYNKRYLVGRVEQELNSIKEFKHNSSLLMIKLAEGVDQAQENEKIKVLMDRTIARLLLKTSRRSDIVAHYGKGVFSMLLTHTNCDNAEKASQRLCDLVSSSNFFIGEKEVELKISIGIIELNVDNTTEQNIVCGIDSMHEADKDPNVQYFVCMR